MSATDCADPTMLGINILFAPASDPTLAPAGNYCVDLEAADSAGNISNLLTNLCVTHNP